MCDRLNVLGICIYYITWEELNNKVTEKTMTRISKVRSIIIVIIIIIIIIITLSSVYVHV